MPDIVCKANSSAPRREGSIVVGYMIDSLGSDEELVKY